MELPFLPIFKGLSAKLESKEKEWQQKLSQTTLGQFPRALVETTIRPLIKMFAPAIPETEAKIRQGKPLLQAFKEVWQEADIEAQRQEDIVQKNFETAKERGASSWELAKIKSESPLFKKIIATSATFSGGIKIIKQEAIEQTVKKLTYTIKEAKPIREVTEELFTAERAKRAAVGAEALEAVPGEKGFFAALSKLKGKLPKAKFEPIREAFTQTEIDDLFNYVKQAPLDFYDKITVSTGLSKILGVSGGGVPTEGELKLLGDVFGRDLVKTVLSKRPWQTKAMEVFAEAMNIPRALMTSIDMSAWLRQGAVLTTYKPKISIKNAGKMFKFFGSDRIFKESMEEIAERPSYGLMKQSGLSLTEITEEAITLTSKEESFMSNFATKIPIVGKLVKASERAYVGFLNMLRADVFDDVANEFMQGGFTPAQNPQVFSNLADFINNATGRGELPTALKRIAPQLNGVFFSPRFMASRLQMLNPAWYMKLAPPVRKEAAKSMVKFVGTGLAILGLAKLAGAEVEPDPRSSDFGKIRLGNVRWDIWAGFQQWVRITAQMITGQVKSTTTGKIRELSAKDFPFETRLTRIESFLRGKLAPIPALAVDLLAGENVIGEELAFKKTLYEKLVPIYLQDLMEAVDEMGWPAIPAVGIPGFFGIGTQAYKEQKKKAGDLPAMPLLPVLPTLPKLPAF